MIKSMGNPATLGDPQTVKDQMGNPATLENEAPTKILGQKKHF